MSVLGLDSGYAVKYTPPLVLIRIQNLFQASSYPFILFLSVCLSFNNYISSGIYLTFATQVSYSKSEHYFHSSSSQMYPTLLFSLIFLSNYIITSYVQSIFENIQLIHSKQFCILEILKLQNTRFILANNLYINFSVLITNIHPSNKHYLIFLDQSII